jgi:uncharacterized protein YbjT (DUF2867 family)
VDDVTKPILVTGGTGTLGREVVRRLLAAGQDVRVLTRRHRPAAEHAWAVGDLASGEGIAGAVDGVATIVHCATSGRGDAAATRRLADAAKAAGVTHLLYISIVGIDAIPMFYYRAKLDAEQVVEGSGVPWTILRATQFHDLVATMSSAQHRLPVLFALSGVRFQPIDTGTVADRMIELALAPAAGRVPDIGGPEVRTSADLARAYLAATGRKRPVVSLRLPGKIFRALRAGANLTPQHATGKIAFEEFLKSR